MEPFPDLQTLSDDELKNLIHDYERQENEISYERRLLHGKIGLLRAELVARLQKKGEGSLDVEKAREALEPARREWIWNAVRQIRTIALANQTSLNEYLQVVVISLLRFARLPRRGTDTSVAEERKAYAYFIADKLAKDVTSNA